MNKKKVSCDSINHIFGDYYVCESSYTFDNISVKFISDAISDTRCMPNIEKVVFNDPATIVFWDDGTKTVVKCQKDRGDTFSKETGLSMAIAKKAYGNNGRFNDIINKWL